MHFYHETEDRFHKSVVSIFFDRKAGGNQNNSFIANLFESPSHETIHGLATWMPLGVHVEELLLKLDRNKIFHYEGSLTVPPCTENVEWNIIDDPQPISDEQLEIFVSKWGRNKEFAGGRGNNRRTQPLLKRKIYYLGAAQLLRIA